jgi:hypothetical protein
VGVKPNIDLHIDELVLHGFPPGDRDAIAEAVQQELARRFAETGAAAALLHNRQIDRLDGGAIQVAPNARPRTVGAQIAGAVYGGLSKGK